MENVAKSRPSAIQITIYSGIALIVVANLLEFTTHWELRICFAIAAFATLTAEASFSIHRRGKIEFVDSLLPCQWRWSSTSHWGQWPWCGSRTSATGQRRDVRFGCDSTYGCLQFVALLESQVPWMPKTRLGQTLWLAGLLVFLILGLVSD